MIYSIIDKTSIWSKLTDNFKTQLAQKLISDRIIEIEKENLSSAGGKPTLPIEKILSEIFHTIPRISFSYPIY